MSDTVTAKGSAATFTPHPEGQFPGQCVDVIDLGEKLQDYPGTKFYLAPTAALVFRTGELNENGDFIDIAREFTVSMGDRANLKKFLEQWRGKAYTREQIEEGVPLHKLTGQHALLTIAQRVSQKGRPYANITACVGIPKQMKDAVEDYRAGYTRAEYWEARKADYASVADTFRAQSQQALADHFDELPAALIDEDDDLPF